MAFANNLIGYSIKLNSATKRPSSHVIICLKEKITMASRILFLGIRINSKTAVIISEDISIIVSILISSSMA
ncbi:hypothetical protein [Acetivibrio straminisolvens]|uniref:hypothetical protein n=1 Tax=Acetivibrio straminisolvens TaxID=253314 RepID=UPI00056EEB73|nr:hypothetical protein [Acetivibrio straminisolvens]